jgi:signal transduction histidine kinase
VNLSWVRETYFAELSEQVSRLGRASPVMSVSFLDEDGFTVTHGLVQRTASRVKDRPFPLLFVDPGMLPVLPPPELPVRWWLVRVQAEDEKAMRAAAGAANVTFALILLAVVTIAGGMTLTIRAVIAGARLAALKSDLIAALTHELKTPVSSIQLASQTLAQGRYCGSDAVERYSKLLLRESSRLNRLVCNLLTFSRLTDAPPSYSFEAIHVGDVIEDALETFQAQIEERKAAISLEIPQQLPELRADRAAILRAFENVIDNAIRYSAEHPSVSIVARATQSEVHVWVADSGPGIPSQEIARVFEKFVRGSRAVPGGTGLGLAIARRIVEDHGGRIELRSTQDEGTQVLVSMPACTEQRP